MKNNKEIKIDPWGNPMVILTQEDAWPLITAVSLYYLKSQTIFLPEMIFHFMLKMIPSYQTLSKTLDIPNKNIPIK